MKRVRSLFDGLILLSVVFVFLAMMLPRIFGITPYVVMSSSMYPVFDAGAVCYIDTKDPVPEIGDIVAYRLEDQLITHRVVGIDEDNNYILRGDNNEVEDLSPVSREQIVGKNIFWIPNLGYLVVFIRSLRGKILILSATAAYFILGLLLDEMPRREKAVSRQKKRRTAGRRRESRI